MLTRATFFLLLACSAIPPSISADDYPFKSINQIRKLAGASARNCGLVGIEQSEAALNQCAMEAFKSGKPFYVGVVRMGIDTRNFEGFAQDDKGNLFHLWYWQSIPVRDSGHTKITNCPKPFNLRIANGVHLSCDRD
jgi:hypothetical protein